MTYVNTLMTLLWQIATYAPQRLYVLINYSFDTGYKLIFTFADTKQKIIW